MAEEYILCELKKKDAKDLTEKELALINSLIKAGKELLDKLSKPVTFDELNKLVKSYASSITKSYNTLNNLIDKLLSANPDLSIKIDSIIKFANKLIEARNRASVVNKYFEGALTRLRKLLLKYRVNLKLDYELKFSLKNSRIYDGKIILNLDEATISDLIINILHSKEQFIKENFLVTEDRLIKSDKLNAFINNINLDNLRKCLLNNDPRFENAILKAYVLLNELKKVLSNLASFLKTNLIAERESELDLKYELINQRFSEDACKFKDHLRIIKKLIDKGVVLAPLISKQLLEELLFNTTDFLKAWAFTKTKINRLADQLAYEYLSVYGEVERLYDLSEFKKRSPYILFKKIFS